MERFPFGTGGGVHVTKVADWGFFVNESRRMTSDPADPSARLNPDAAWWADAELVIVRVTPAGSVERELTIESFPVQLPEPGAQ
jgi:hypothetical protein